LILDSLLSLGFCAPAGHDAARQNSVADPRWLFFQNERLDARLAQFIRGTETRSARANDEGIGLFAKFDVSTG